MDKAKGAIRDFVSKSGHHDTTVHKETAAPVQHEHVKPMQHKEVNAAVDKEVHQDHYHNTVQPIQDREVLPEQHQTQLGEVQHRDFDHRNKEKTKEALAAEQSKFRDERKVHDTQYTESYAPVEEGEHVHHHVHETIQPMVHKETIQPNVLHTTVPVHETHHNPTMHHATSSLPPVSMSDFKKQGGALGGERETYDTFAGEPNDRGGISSVVHGSGGHGVSKGYSHGDSGYTHEGSNSLERGTEQRGSGMHGDSSREYSRVGSNSLDQGTEPRESAIGRGNGQSGYGESGNRYGDDGMSSSGKSASKPSLMDKLNPKVDADGDGKAGFMK